MKAFVVAFLMGACMFFFKSCWPILLAVPLSLVFYRFLRPALITTFFLGLLCGVIWSFCYSSYQHQWTLPKSLESKNIQISGEIVSLPKQHSKNTSYLFAVNHINNNSIPRVIVKLSWYSPLEPLHIGDQWRVIARLKRPHGLHNPGGFDYEQWLYANNISATGYVVGKLANKRFVDGANLWSIGHLREYLTHAVLAVDPGNDNLGIICALVTGVRYAINPNMTAIFKDTGTSHLIAISGLHVGLVAALLFAVFHFLWSRSLRLISWVPAPQFAAIFALSGAWFYCLLAGTQAPTVRASIMATVFFGGMIAKRNTSSWSSWCLALLLVMISNPQQVLLPGLWLSFGAVALIFMSLSKSDTPKWKAWVKIQLAITLGLLPICVLFFSQCSLISPIANLVAIPWVSMLVVPLAFLACLSLFVSSQLAQWLFLLAAKLIGLLVMFLTYVATIPYGNLHVNINNVWPDSLSRGQARFTLLDVGQGLASVIQTQHHVLVYDTGAKLSPFFDMGTAAVLPFLRYHHISQVDRLVISHGDNDHIGGAWAVLKALPVHSIYTSVPGKFENYKHVVSCHEGQHWQWDGVSFRMLYPSSGLNKKYRGNNRSCVLQIITGKNKVLLTGDIETPAEKIILKNNSRSILKSTILVAPHHGSKTSSSQAFIDAVHPDYILYPVGYLNKFHFPSQIVQDRYNKVGSIPYATDKEGAVTFLMSPNVIVRQ